METLPEETATEKVYAYLKNIPFVDFENGNEICNQSAFTINNNSDTHIATATSISSKYCELNTDQYVSSNINDTRVSPEVCFQPSFSANNKLKSEDIKKLSTLALSNISNNNERCNLHEGENTPINDNLLEICSDESSSITLTESVGYVPNTSSDTSESGSENKLELEFSKKCLSENVDDKVLNLTNVFVVEVSKCYLLLYYPVFYLRLQLSIRNTDHLYVF